MNAMTSRQPKAGYRAAPTASQAAVCSVDGSESSGLGSGGSRYIPVAHHENLTTSGLFSELLKKAVAVSR